MKHQFIETALGLIHCLEAGEGDPLLLLHSNGCSAYEYQKAIELLAPRRRVIAWDMPGHGDSDPITRHYSVADYAEAAVALLDGLNIPQADIAGASIGGSISVALGARHGERVRGLIPVETPIRTPEEWDRTWTATEVAFGSTTQTEEQLRPRLREVSPELLTRWNIDRNKAGVKTMIDVMWAIRDYDVVADCPRITSPTLVMFGDKGPLIAKAEMMAGAIAGARLHVAQGCGHFPMLDDPAAFAEAINAFLDAHAAGPRP